MNLLNTSKIKSNFKKLISKTEGTSQEYPYFVVVYNLIDRKKNDQALAYITSLEDDIIKLFPDEVLRLIKYL